MSRTNPTKQEFDALLARVAALEPRYEKTFTVSSHGYVVLDANPGMTPSKITNIESLVYGPGGHVYSPNYYGSSSDGYFIYVGADGQLRIWSATTYPTTPFTVTVRIWYDD